ncbi:NADH:flavin oxidoreductase/NADH oxidase [Sphingomonas sp.]|uniref:NADH:flavin oxidoreductase/NADH oxidase n=1 Tax=Sphingomonas sp. TaxID=28214 RepID=UPI0025D014CF|nr:NADH:flavin oxidoreductase/NADH oxidase [Sphingomonas sp.]MBV9528298.1 NADH:flavin oxidoreductase/NADH oxidase [Sphingomonas sp.]
MSSLFNGIVLGELSLQNRVVVPPMCQYMATDGLPCPWHDMHYGGLGISGAGLVIMEGTAVEAIGRISLGDLGLYNDEQEAALKQMLARIRTYSTAKWGIQLAHAGRKASSQVFDAPYPVPPEEGGWIPIGPSAIAHSDRWPAPTEMSQAEIARVVESFTDSARRAGRVGFDLIEVHAAHGYLISSFLSPVANRRTDDYGGSLENRMRFALQVASAVRAAWPSHKALGFRVNGTDWIDGGITIVESIKLAKALRLAGVDYLAVSSGGNSRQQKLPPVVPGYQVHIAQAIKEGSGIATMAVGMILDPKQADEIVASGRADLVAIARATLDDPRWALHAAQALGEEIAYPRSYWRTTGKTWPGYKLVHPPPGAETGMQPAQPGRR